MYKLYIGGVVMITVKNAESYLKDSIGEDIDDIKRFGKHLKFFQRRQFRAKKIKKFYFSVVSMILQERNYFILTWYVSLQFMKKMIILTWNNCTVNFYLNQQAS
ncbi:hypothetical protein ACEQPO_06780 [Bacillus sp. SL00103]